MTKKTVTDSKRKVKDKKGKPATIPEILRAQRHGNLSEIVDHVFWHSDFKNREDDVLWGKEVNVEGIPFRVMIYKCYFVAKRIVYASIYMVSFGKIGVAVSNVRDVQKYLQQDYKINGIALEDLTKEPNRRFSKEFLGLIAKQIWDYTVQNADRVKQLAST